ncbi:MAG TPA: gliding motility-associated C-terminal domain-containing protein [Bacteroidales bacterium]|nr:gliding motility-associated C-terminal domain-containing protein [Bacteroidales bacterium]
MKKLLTILLFGVWTIQCMYGTHNRAGEITYRQLSAYTFEFTITTFTYTLSLADRNELEVQWGDNTLSIAPRIATPDTLPGFYRRNVYKATHTFPGPGIYEVVMQDPNRNFGVLNIPNSVNVIFSVKTTMIINPQLGMNNTPVLLNYPIDKAALGKKFIHNPSAFDIDGDSISYTIGTCSREKGLPIENYTLPKASKSIYIDKATGDLVWDAPVDTGIFNIALNVEEWRKGIKISNIVRDMQIEVYNTKNRPPENAPLRDICVEAGKNIELFVVSTDPNKDALKQTATGGPFAVNTSKATFTTIESTPGYIASAFTWQTSCEHVRKQPYLVVIKSEDIPNDVKLTDIDNFSIKVLAPAPKNLKATAGNNAIKLAWSKSVCTNATGYAVYRSTVPETLAIDSCNGGIPETSNFKYIGSTKNIKDTVFLDDNAGKSLSLGVNYCYRVVATFADGAMSYPSGESCAILVAGTPALTSASVIKIDPAQGEVLLSWIKPSHLDTIPAPGPYEYLIYRANSLDGTNPVLIHTKQTSDLNDTTYTDTGINTIQYPYNYKVELYNNTPGNRFAIGDFEMASTMYPNLKGSDNQITVSFMKKVPWLNTTYTIYRQNPVTFDFDSIGQTTTEEYVDKGLGNGTQYRYRIKSYGFRTMDGKVYNTLNWSHINSGSAIDTTAPCPPELEVKSVCDSSLNLLRWQNPNHICADDVIRYNIFFKHALIDNFTPITTIENASDTIFRHRPEETLAGCYAVSAVDSFGNESPLTNVICVDICTGYALPNVFTPNNDNKNDFFKSYNPGNYVKQVDMKIFNRWGKLVYKTTDANINWDGKEMNNKKTVSAGVYYYVCDVYEPRLTGVQVKTLTGFIHVYTSEAEKPFIE